MGALKKNSPPHAAVAQPGSSDHDTDPASLPVRSEGTETANDAYAFLPTSLPDRDVVADVLRGFKDAQDEAWAPTPEFVASSAGAEFAAYQTRHLPAARHDTPTPAGAAVILNVTEPIPDVTQLDLATVIERAKVRAEGAADVQGGREDEGVTTQKRERRAAPPRMMRPLAIALIGLGVLVALGLVYAFAFSGVTTDHPAAASAAPASAAAGGAVAPSASASATPSFTEPPSPPPSTVVTAARRPAPSANLATPVPVLSARPRALPSASSAAPTAEPKRDAAPKNDFVW